MAMIPSHPLLLMLASIVLGGCVVATCWAEHSRRERLRANRLIALIYARGVEAGQLSNLVEASRTILRYRDEYYRRGWAACDQEYYRHTVGREVARRVWAAQGSLN